MSWKDKYLQNNSVLQPMFQANKEYKVYSLSM